MPCRPTRTKQGRAGGRGSKGEMYAGVFIVASVGEDPARQDEQTSDWLVWIISVRSGV